MTKPVSRKLAVQCLLQRVFIQTGRYLLCSVCMEDIKPEDDVEFDHIHADELGGDHHYTNLRPLHRQCHRSKKTPKDIKAIRKANRIAAGGRKRKGPEMQSRPFPKVRRPMRAKP